mmetsp:Transcript_9756/g.36339  ORF Transcript_9756/g.36339 Transcript_9756/m.36339 type:complete len:311 (-) Transcript_9756:3517-4449(-)
MFEEKFQKLLTGKYCEKIRDFHQNEYKLLLENENYEEVDLDILKEAVDGMSFRLSQIFQVHLPYLTQSKKNVHLKKFLQTGIVEHVSVKGSLDIFVDCIISRLFEVPCWLPNHLRDKRAWNVSWHHWLHALFNASLKTTTMPKKVNKQLRSTTLELHERPYVEWAVFKIWHMSGIKVRRQIHESAPRTPFETEWQYFVTKDSDVEKYGWRVFGDPADAQSIITNCEMKQILEGERRMMVDTWNAEEERKRRGGNSNSKTKSSKPPQFSREQVSKKYRNGKHTLILGKDRDFRSFHDIFYSDKLDSKLGGS